MIQFLLNDKLINTDMPPGMVMVDFIRYHQHLTGTKIGCREGDCGACTILTGELKNRELVYSSVTSCLMPLANAHGKHVVTIEGINLKDLNVIQQVMCDESATQCGFCTPGFIMSLAGYCLTNKPAETDTDGVPNVIAAVDGNICRCTGYKSIERAAHRLAEVLKENPVEETIPFLIERSVLPAYFAGVATRLESIHHSVEHVANDQLTAISSAFLGGGTDLYVQQAEALVNTKSNFMFNRSELKGISKHGNKCIIGAEATVADIVQSPIMQEYFPDISKFIRLVSSTPIRNMATVAGNFINASPIGDLSIFFLALDAHLILSDDSTERPLRLQDLYLGYKTLAKKTSEYITQIWFLLPEKNSFFNFEKVSKRTHLDIASVNTALSLTVEDNIITHARLSAGGVAPVPFFLTNTSGFLKNKELCSETIHQFIQHALSEVSPISDVRGTATYKGLLLKQLIKSHFITMFPYLEKEELIYL